MMTAVLRSRRLFSFAARRLYPRCLSTSLPYVNEDEKFSSTETGTKCNFIHPSAVVHPDAILGQIIGDNNLIMGSCHIAHDCKVGNNNIFANNTLLAGHVVVEDFTHTAGATVVHQFCHIGSFSFIGGGSVEKDEKLSRVPAVSFLVQSIRDSFAEERRGICKFRSWAGS
ncbi:UNVERIFIED_CONTAM: putative acyl-[acyl-carrier-protein]--UDP-N-acetylglucosamine O-acyltransferase, mitochondrial [Sesamum radiatum]|uniref:Acyl-[acyl-carrier-protein]--UDP-N-acetylglucosamine O-acyltransferase, mitochondrial n=1 Tax=Sesamum radiatum TaxID=300843 RepID=A0AAW2R362_SESRA